MNLIKYKSPLGVISIEESIRGGSVSCVYLPNQKPRIPENPSEFLKDVKSQFAEYFKGKRKVFDFTLNFDICTEFMKSVYEELLKIPYGETATYKDIAEHIGLPKSYRAVGFANNRNPLPIVVPCHRIIGSDGKLVGYAGGIDMKIKLLELEKNNL